MKVYGKLGLILTIIFVSSVTQIVNADTTDMIANIVSKIPESGKLANALLAVVNVLNAIIGRLLGGAPPCVVSINQGLWCSGVARSGGASEFVDESIDTIPEVVLPGPVKEIIKKFLRPLINPIADLLLGGNKIQNEA